MGGETQAANVRKKECCAFKYILQKRIYYEERQNVRV